MFVGESRVQCGTVPGKGCAISQVHGREAVRIQEESSGMAYLYLSGQHRLVQPQLINHRQRSRAGFSVQGFREEGSTRYPKPPNQSRSEQCQSRLTH